MTRLFHHWEKWECFRCGFYETSPLDGMDDTGSRAAYTEFLSDLPRFRAAMQRVLDEWPHSCDQFLSNENINRIAWLGQASMCIETGVPSIYRAGFKDLSPDQQAAG